MKPDGIDPHRNVQCAKCGAWMMARASIPEPILCFECEPKDEGDGQMAVKKKKKTKAPNGDWNGAVKASEEASKRTDYVVRRHFHQKLPVQVGREEVERKAAALAKAVHEREEVRIQKREANARFREQIHYYDELVETLATEVDLKSDSRNVECVEQLTPQNEIVVLRCDTNVVLERRAATSAELQEEMFPGSKGGGAKKEKNGKRIWTEGANPKPSSFDDLPAASTTE